MLPDPSRALTIVNPARLVNAIDNCQPGAGDVRTRLARGSQRAWSRVTEASASSLNHPSPRDAHQRNPRLHSGRRMLAPYGWRLRGARRAISVDQLEVEERAPRAPCPDALLGPFWRSDGERSCLGAAEEQRLSGPPRHSSRLGETWPLLHAMPNCGMACPVKFRHKGLRRFWESGDTRGVPGDLAKRLSRRLDDLAAAVSPDDLRIPGYRLHALTGGLAGHWSIRVSGNWRLVFRFKGGGAVDVDLVDYH